MKQEVRFHKISSNTWQFFVHCCLKECFHYLKNSLHQTRLTSDTSLLRTKDLRRIYLKMVERVDRNLTDKMFSFKNVFTKKQMTKLVKLCIFIQTVPNLFLHVTFHAFHP